MRTHKERIRFPFVMPLSVQMRQIRGGVIALIFLRGLLYGYPASWTFSNKAYYTWRETFKSIHEVMSAHHKRVAHEDLLDHQMLNPDLLVQRSHFSSGVEVTVNYGEFAYTREDGSELPSHGYRVNGSVPGGHSCSSRLAVEIVPGQ